ncbi:B12-binding domain-containing radical SAM protein [Azospirillum agricola]|uniref:B12-binding domain-containing radical SAM protein n=1 Tax=Azospirillum agricola TaxID=1720247 RepID=UPI000A0F2127|nr:radical SAM protein [Azospirillum agricola]SMH41580.1 Radical SAM superfamily enzyme YgiQ, UPF0313 family [Azospirillum lipoferum]
MLRRSPSKRVLLFQVYPVWRGVQSDMRLPVGMLYLAGSLKRAGYDVSVFHVQDEHVDEMLSSLDLHDILFVGVCSVLTGFSLRSAIAFSRKVKAIKSTLPIVWGGVQPTAISEVCLREEFVDAVGMGDGEDVIVEIAHMLNGDMEPKDVKSLAFRDENGKIIVNPRRDITKELDEYEPDFSLIDLNRYIFDGRITGLLMTSRGCPFACTFCYNDYFSKRRWRKHSADFVVNTVQALRQKYYFHTISVSDDLFIVDRKRAIDIIERLHAIGIRVFGVDVKTNFMGEEEIKALARAEVESVFFGLETLQPRLLANMKKEQTNEDVVVMLQRFARLAPKVMLQTGILMALPYERPSEIRSDIRAGLDLYRHNPNLSVYFGTLFPLPGTAMMDAARLNGFDPKTVYDYADIDLNTAWDLCGQWTLFEPTRRDREILRLTEKYSQLAGIPMMINNIVVATTKDRLCVLLFRLLFAVAVVRLRHGLFFLHAFDFKAYDGIWKLYQWHPKLYFKSFWKSVKPKSTPPSDLSASPQSP